MKYPSTQNFINGELVHPNSKKTLEIISPLDGNLLSTIPLSASTDLDVAVKAAAAAFPAWSKTPMKERVQVFFKYKTLLEKHLPELADLCSEENGKTYGESVAEIEKSIELTEFATSLPQLITGEILEVSRGVECRTDQLLLALWPLSYLSIFQAWCPTGRCQMQSHWGIA